MRMRKKIILFAIAALCIAGTVWGYHNINEKFPAVQIKEARNGTQLAFREGVLISLEESKILPEEEYEAFFEMYGEEPIAEGIIFETTVTLENQTEEVQSVEMTSLRLETLGAAFAFPAGLNGLSDGYYAPTVAELQPGEKQTLIYPYIVISTMFSENEWKTVQDREYWLTFSSYPEKTKLYL